ncbi:hypothetical protein I4U23_020187 [Adineta vaga]|nr:hypothetical protein I4U23_020187 [Adineta vaga]
MYKNLFIIRYIPYMVLRDISKMFSVAYNMNTNISKHVSVLLLNTKEMNSIHFVNGSNQLHPYRLLSSEIHYRYGNAKLEQLLQQYQDHSHVNLSGEDLTDEDMNTILNEVIIKKECKQLLLESNKITSIGVSILVQGLHNNNSLNYLDLSHNQISDDGIATLVKILATNNETLTKLGLAKNQITDEGMKCLVKLIKTNRTLTQLDLCSNKIGNEGTRLLMNAITNHQSTIEVLWLMNNPLISDESVDSIIQMIKQTRSLKRLWIFKCSLSEISKRKLKALEPTKLNFKVYVDNWKN